MARIDMGQRTRTTYKETWIQGKTTVIRVPIVLKTQVIDLARQLDKKENLTADSKKDKRQLLKILDKFIELKRSQYGQNSAQKGEFSRTTRNWSMFNQLYDYLKE